MNYESIIVDARRLLSEARKAELEKSGKDINKNNYVWVLNPNTWDEIIQMWRMVSKDGILISDGTIFGIDYRFGDLPDGVIILQKRGVKDENIN